MSGASAPSPANRRRFGRYFALVERKRAIQGKIAVALLFAAPVVAILATHLLVGTIHNLVGIDPRFADRVRPVVADLTTIALIYMGLIALLCATTVYFVLFVGVRVYGPQVALVNFIKRLQSGDYGQFRKLREGDELTEIWGELQKLAEILRRDGNAKTKPTTLS